MCFKIKDPLIEEEQREMYKYVMRNCNAKDPDKDSIISYLVEQCYWVEMHNDFLTGIIQDIKSALKAIADDDNQFENHLPF